jgi:ribose-phosphate pyrophosphokinase
MILLNGKEVEFKTFPNGETLFKKDGLTIEVVNTVSFKYTNDSDLIKLMFLKNYLDLQGTVNGLTMYYMPYSRMDRSEEGSPFTLKYVADFINSLKFNHIDVIEPHSDVACAVLNNATANYINFKLLPMVMSEIGYHPVYDYIVFPDAGASKRYSKIVAPNQLVGHKKRSFEEGNIESLELIGNIDTTYGKKAIIVDDLSSYGTTFVRASEKLKEAGIEQVYLLVAHAEDSILKPHPVTGVKLLDHVDKVFTTNSILSGDWSDGWYNAKFKDKVKVYNIEELLK